MREMKGEGDGKVNESEDIEVNESGDKKNGMKNKMAGLCIVRVFKKKLWMNGINIDVVARKSKP